MKLLPLSLALLMTTGVSAQTSKGVWLLGAGSDLGFTSTSRNGSNSSQFSLDVRAGYFVIDDLALGLDLGFATLSAGGNTTSGISAGPFARYYLLDSKVFGEARYAYATTADDGPDFVSGTLGLGAGVAVWLTDNVTIEPILRYSMTNTSPSVGADYTSNSFGVAVNFGIYLGGEKED